MRTAFLDIEKTEPSNHAIDFMNLFIPLYIQRDKPYGIYAAQTVHHKEIIDANGRHYRVWLTKISKVPNPRGYTNLVEDGGRTFHEINEEHQIVFEPHRLNEIKIIFTRYSNERQYRFIGLFEPDPDRSYPGHKYYRRIATRADFTVDPPVIYREDDSSFDTERTTDMTEWIVPCNPQKYDLETELKNNDIVYWRQNAKYTIGDIVFIYLSAGRSVIRYKTTVTEINIDAEQVDDTYWLDKSMNGENPKRICLKLLKEFDDSQLSIDELRKHGLKSTLQGPIKLTGELADYFHAVDEYNRVVSFSCGPTYDLVRSTFVHAHPIKNGFPKKPVRWLMIRKHGGISEEIYEVFDTVDAFPDEVENVITSEQRRVLRYRDQRKTTYGFATKDCKYRFYLLRVAYRLDPPFVMTPNIQGYKYYELKEVLEYTQKESEADDINIPVKPLNTAVVDGLTKVTCARCHYQFIKAPRCPECGQLHTY